jgi:hypothetical protein
VGADTNFILEKTAISAAGNATQEVGGYPPICFFIARKAIPEWPSTVADRSPRSHGPLTLRDIPAAQLATKPDSASTSPGPGFEPAR